MRTGIATGSLDVKKNLSEFRGVNGIPSGPKIPLKNYLLDLVAESDSKRSSIYLKGVEKFIQEIWEEMVMNNWKALNVRKFIPEKLGISTIYPYKHGRKAISIQNLYKLLFLWKEYCQKNSREVEEKWNEIYKSDFTFSIHKNSQPTELPKYLTPKLSYIIGFICGDGHLADYGHHYLIKISEKSIPQLRFVLHPLFEDLFNINAPIFQIYKGGYALQIGNKAIFRFLTRVLKVKVGEIPEIVKDVDSINKKYFLIGLFDSEGSVTSSYLDARIVVYQSDYKFLEQVIELFRELNVHFNGPYRHESEKGIWYHIAVRRKSEIVKYISEIGTCHIEKFLKIRILREKLYAHRYRYNST